MGFKLKDFGITDTYIKDKLSNPSDIKDNLSNPKSVLKDITIPNNILDGLKLPKSVSDIIKAEIDETIRSKSKTKPVDEYIEVTIPGLGYIDGYREKEIPNRNDGNVEKINTILSRTEEELRTGIEKERKGLTTFIEDPLFNGFDVLFIKNTPLFKENRQSENSNSTYKFLRQYTTIPEMSKRIILHKNFINLFNQFFTFDQNNTNSEYRDYIIENISGLDKLNAKIVGKDEKITLTLSENLSMSVLYLAELYNNLVFDYNGVREMIPDNCLRFNMYIKVQDMRVIQKTKQSTGEDVKYKADTEQSHMIYVLQDCLFDFSDSKNIESDIPLNGYGTSLYSNPAKVTVDINYKSIKRIFNPKNITNGVYMDNKNLFSNDDNYDMEYSTIFNDIKHKDIVKDEVIKIKKRGIIDVGPVKDTTITEKIEKALKKEVKDRKDKLYRDYKKKRGSLVDSILDKVINKTSLPKDIAINLHIDDYINFNIDMFAKKLGGKKLIDTVSSKIDKSLDNVSTLQDKKNTK